MLRHRDAEWTAAQPLLSDERALLVADALRAHRKQGARGVIVQQQHGHVGMGDRTGQLERRL
jgi:hypothetical protein